MGVRPTVRGVVMNPCDHPHGGGEGKSPVGMPAPVTPWGKVALGLKTRKHKKYSNKTVSYTHLDVYKRQDTLRSHSSLMFMPPTVTASTSGRRRRPPQARQLSVTMYSSYAAFMDLSLIPI